MALGVLDLGIITLLLMQCWSLTWANWRRNPNCKLGQNVTFLVSVVKHTLPPQPDSITSARMPGQSCKNPPGFLHLQTLGAQEQSLATVCLSVCLSPGTAATTVVLDAAKRCHGCVTKGTQGTNSAFCSHFFQVGQDLFWRL